MAEFLEDNNHLYKEMYRAKVEAIDDDPKGLNRIRVRVLGIHSFNDAEDDQDGIPIAHLPLAEQAGSLFGGFSKDNDNKSGISTIPSVGSWVWVFFENGNHNKPIYTYSIIGKDDQTDIDTDAPDEVSTLLSKAGFKFQLIDKEDENKFAITTPGGQQFILDDTTDAEKTKLLSKSESGFEIDEENGIVSIKDEINGGQSIIMDENGIIESDANENTQTMNSDGHEIAGKNNTILLEQDGITVTSSPTGQIVIETTTGNIEVKPATGKIIIENNLASLKDILDNILGSLINLQTPGNAIGNLGAPVINALAVSDLPNTIADQVLLNLLME